MDKKKLEMQRVSDGSSNQSCWIDGGNHKSKC
jgi:hypothetical protein